MRYPEVIAPVGGKGNTRISGSDEMIAARVPAASAGRAGNKARIVKPSAHEPEAHGAATWTVTEKDVDTRPVAPDGAIGHRLPTSSRAMVKAGRVKDMSLKSRLDQTNPRLRRG
jgi:hypothetical protein